MKRTFCIDRIELARFACRLAVASEATPLRALSMMYLSYLYSHSLPDVANGAMMKELQRYRLRPVASVNQMAGA
ncbi:hypothetical protein [Parendozoicomonas sp. Alg238-R29]|uniref:hypothetical protein n=1 Tax=Parendozoicomonas sp. Alg238-R29 TaxID=2993446 RepID=UPI00248D72F5|nr:hypothetical protein [Parendozoicomonas sp. Alg238-R29]